MKILYVIHNFLPYSLTGVENYTYNIANALHKNHNVMIYTSIFNPEKERFERFSYEYDRLRVEAFYHNSVFRNFSETFSNQLLDEYFENLIEEFQPDIVHFQHLMFHSIGYVDILNKKDIPSALTLHDFYYYCPNLGQRLFLGRYNCRNESPLKCSLCFRTSNINISEMDRFIYNKVKGSNIFREISKEFPELAYPVKWMRIFKKGPTAYDIIEREQVMLEALGKISVIISPSDFYRRFYERYTGHNRIIHLDYGFDKNIKADRSVRDRKKLKIGFIGTISRHKGANILIDIAKKFSGKVKILVWGNDKNDAILSKRLKSIENIEYRGEFLPEKRREVFREIDYLLVPSIWEENSPLVIHEALIYNTPVIASNRGGNAELIIEGKNGFLFDPSNLNSLYQLIQRIFAGEISLDSVDSSVVMAIEDHIKRLEEIYREL